MKFSEYVALREQERAVTISSLLQEIEELERQVMILSAAFRKATGKHHKVGFRAKGDEDDKD